MAVYEENSVRPGPYRRYDGVQVEVLYVTSDIDTGGEIIVCRDAQRKVYTITLQSFLARTAWEGLFVTKYQPLEQEASASQRRPRQAEDYYSYAKDLCEHFAEDLRQYKLCVEQKQLFMPKEDFLAIKEDMGFLSNCLKTVLAPYNNLFKGRFMEGKSIRKYAEATGSNRGSVDYMQRKLFTVLAAELQARDEADGKTRLAAPKTEN